MTRADRHSRWLYLLLFLWMALGVAYYVAGVAGLREIWFRGDRHGEPSFRIDDDGRLMFVDDNTAKDTGFANGDFVLAVNGRPYTGSEQKAEFITRARPGDSMTMTVRQKNGAERTVPVRLKPIQGPPKSFTTDVYLVMVLFVPLLSLAVGCWVVAARPRDPNAWLVLVILTLVEIAFGDLQPGWWPGFSHALFAFWNRTIQNLWFPALALFGLFFPVRSRIDVRWPWLKWVIVALQAWCFGFYLWHLQLELFNAQAIPGFSRLEGTTDWIAQALEIACVVLFLVAIVDKQLSASTADARRRLRVLTVGSCLSLGPVMIIFIVFPLFGLDPHYGAYYVLIVPLIALFPLTLAYVLVVQRAMGIGVLLRMGTKYLLAKGTLIAIEVGLAVFIVLYFVVAISQHSLNEVTGYILLGIAVVVLSVRHRLNPRITGLAARWLDRKFFRESYDAEVILSELSEHARTFTEQGPLIENITRRVSDVLHVPQIAVWLKGGAVFQLQQALGFDAPGPVLIAADSATVSNLSRTNLPARVYRDRPDPWLVGAPPDEISVLEQVHAEVLLPLPGRDRLMGVMALGPKKSEEPYTPTDLRVLQSVATQTGLALEVSELAHSLAKEAAERARNDRELEIAHEVQDRLFPQHIPAVQGMTLAGRCRPARGVGGDYYDMIELENGGLGLAIGDVSGKGIPAALLMASLRSCLRTMTLVDPNDAGRLDLAALMRRMNQLVFEASAMNRYATFFFAVCDPCSRTLKYVNAGHNAPIVFRCAERILLEATGPVVGLLRNVEFEERTLALQPGDVLLAYTDGISEALNAVEEEWGEERMIQAAQAALPGRADEILGAVFQAAVDFIGNAAQYDDMTLLVAAVQ